MVVIRMGVPLTFVGICVKKKKKSREVLLGDLKRKEGIRDDIYRAEKECV